MSRYKIMDRLEGILIHFVLWGLVATLLVQIYKLSMAANACQM